MKRDLNLLRRILLAIEESVDDEPASIKLPTSEYDDVHIAYHVRLLTEGGLIHAIKARSFDATRSWIPHSLTWKGHNFLNAVRDDSIWREIKTQVKNNGADLPVEIIYELALREIRQRIGLMPMTRRAVSKQGSAAA